MISIQNQQKKVPIHSFYLKKIIKKILRYEGVVKEDLSLVFVTDRKIKVLNKKYLSHDFVTDVLSFDYTLQTDSSLLKRRGSKTNLDGEIIVSAITAFKNAKKYKVSPHEELVLYVIHGILHLLNYEDHSTVGKKRMRSKEQEILNRVDEDIKKMIKVL